MNSAAFCCTSLPTVRNAYEVRHHPTDGRKDDRSAFFGETRPFSAEFQCEFMRRRTLPARLASISSHAYWQWCAREPAKIGVCTRASDLQFEHISWIPVSSIPSIHPKYLRGLIHPVSDYLLSNCTRDDRFTGGCR